MFVFVCLTNLFVFVCLTNFLLLSTLISLLSNSLTKVRTSRFCKYQ